MRNHSSARGRLVLTWMILKTLFSPISFSLDPFDALYLDGTAALHGGDFRSAALSLQKAIDNYHELRSTKVRCRVQCLDEHPFKAPLSDLQFFDSCLRRASCLNECIEGQIGPLSLHRVNEEVSQEFLKGNPHRLLQLAYCKLQQEEDVLAVTQTCVEPNLDHKEAGVRQGQEEEEDGMFFSRSGAVHHQDAFVAGLGHSIRGEYREAIAHLELALDELYQADVACRVLCEREQRFSAGHPSLYRPSLYELVADHYHQVLLCKHNCMQTLSTFPGQQRPMDSYLPLHYDHLQQAYFTVGNAHEAMACAHAYLLFHEDDTHMVKNIQHYRRALQHDVSAREEAELYVRRHRLEAELLLEASKNQGTEFIQENSWRQRRNRKDVHRMPSDADGLIQSGSACEERDPTSEQGPGLMEGGPLLYDDVQLVLNSTALNGTQRVLLDNVISEDDCSKLMNLASVISTVGDGYHGNMSPHTPNERFEGSTILRALQSVNEGQILIKSARLFYDVSEKARRIVHSYFMLRSTLHFSYTHLVCRTALTGRQDGRQDLSHPVHGDNCILDHKSQKCLKVSPAYTHRDYSALLYLNGDFDGGEFIFTEMDGKTLTASIRPKCGRMLGFSSGGENIHGVRAVTRGQRCALGMWFTMDPRHRDKDMLRAATIFRLLDGKHEGAQGTHLEHND